MKSKSLNESDIQVIVGRFSGDDRLKAAALFEEIARRLTALAIQDKPQPDCWKNHPRAPKGGAK